MRRGKSINVLALTVASAVAQSLSAGVAYAQAQASTDAARSATATSAGGDQLEEVVVTAERRTSDVQHTADSISVLEGANLRLEGRTTTRQILEDIPGLAVTTNSQAVNFNVGTDNQGSQYAIRGVASNGTPIGQIISNVPTTAVYVDGVYEGVGGNYDIDRVEVLRGPQGTLYGRNATSGVVSMYTVDPKLDHFGGDALAEIGTYSLQHYSGAVNLPMGDTLALRVSADNYKRNGYYATDGIGANESTDARAKLLYKPNDALSVLLGYALEDNHVGSGGQSGLIPYGAYNSVDYSQVLPTTRGINNFRQYWANINWDVGPATLTYIPAFRTWYQNAATVSHGLGLNGTQTEFTPLDQFMTHELRLASNPGSKLSWLIGGYYYDNRVENSTANSWTTPLPAPAGQFVYSAQASKETKDVGVFTEETYPITPTTRLTGGVRYDYTYVQTNELYTLNPSGTLDALILNGTIPAPLQTGNDPANYVSAFIGGQAGTRRFYDLTYKARIEQDLTPSNMLYGMISTGFVPGDIQIRTGAGPCALGPLCLALPPALTSSAVPEAAPYGKETLTSYELGSKNRFLNNTLQVNGDVWYYRYGGYQIAVIPDANNPSTQALVNVPMRMLGAELEINWLPTADDRVGLSYGYTDAYFLDRNAIQPISPAEPFSYFYQQSHLAGVPPNTVNVTYDHTIHLPGGSTLTPHGDARLLSAHDVQGLSQTQVAQGASPYVHVGDELVGDLTLTWASSMGTYSVSGYVRNVGDNRYKTTVTPITLTAGPNFQVAGSQYDPRTFGVIGSVHF